MTLRPSRPSTVEQLTANTQAVAAEHGFTTTSTTSPTLVRPVDRVITRMLIGDCRTCPHVTAAAPQPLAVNLWDDPPTFRCRRCIPDDAGLTDVEDRTCDLCRVDTGGDGVYPTITTVGAITIAYGVCEACHNDLEEHAA